jgi:rhodanese-related sulfurtransferase
VEQLPLEISPLELRRMLEAGEPVALVDVREAHEHALCRIDGAELVPLGSIPQAFSSLKEKSAGRRLVLYCHHGVRSLRAASWLRQRGIPHCQSMSGGIDRWAASVDPGIGRY